jgi:acyl homoserine lactone synthase
MGQYKSRELVRQGGYEVCVISATDKLEEAFRLRYEVFCRSLGWTKRTGDGRETDSFDESAMHFGAYGDDGALAAYVRLILPSGRFMLEDVFVELLGEYPLVRKESDTAEVSRLCMATRRRDEAPLYGRTDLVMLLFEGLHRWCFEEGIRFLYAVAEERLCRLYYKKGLRFRVMGEPVKMPDGLVARAAVLDWREQKRFKPPGRP